MNSEELKQILNQTHINSWIKYYRDNPDVQGYLRTFYKTVPKTTSDVYALFYLVMHDMKEYPTSYCGEPAKFLKYNRGFAGYCLSYQRSLKTESCAVCHTKLYENRNTKSKETSMMMYGVEHPQQHDSVKDKTIRTNIEKYGYKSHNSVDEIKKKKEKTYLTRYGVDNPSKLPTTKKTVQEYWIDERYKIISDNLDSLYVPLFDESDLLDKCSRTALPFYCNSCNSLFYKQHRYNRVKCKCQMNTKKSSSEMDILDYIRSLTDLEIKTNDRTICSPKELDIYIPELNLAFEYNGVYWHSTNNKRISKTYHQEKVLRCKEQGINLIHIFEDEWNDPEKNSIIRERIKSKIHKSDIVYARKCEVREISSKLSSEFCELHHIQGKANSSVQIGLFYEMNLVGVMTFGKSRFDKNYQYELIRYCSIGTIVGGASKILTYFERNYKPLSLMTYADMNWSNGNLYEKIGFSYDSITEPGYFYYDQKTKGRVSRQACQKHKLVKMGYPPTLTETEICLDILKYFKVYNSGNLKYVKKY